MVLGSSRHPFVVRREIRSIGSGSIPAFRKHAFHTFHFTVLMQAVPTKDCFSATHNAIKEYVSRSRESNPVPAHYECAALPGELPRRYVHEYTRLRGFRSSGFRARKKRWRERLLCLAVFRRGCLAMGLNRFRKLRRMAIDGLYEIIVVVILAIIARYMPDHLVAGFQKGFGL